MTAVAAPASPESAFTELQKCPTLYATTDDAAAVMARLSTDAQHLAVMASITADGTNLAANFDVSDLTPIKEQWAGGSSAWSKFFTDVQFMFNHNLVKLSAGTLVLQPADGGPKRISFQLSPTAEKVQETIFSALLNYHHIHVHLREVEKHSEDTKQREIEVTSTATELEKEEDFLNETLTRNKDWDSTNARRLDELDGQIVEAEAEKHSTGQPDDEGLTEDEDALVCRARLPLRKKHAKDVDAELLQYIKSKYIKGSDVDQLDPDAPFNAIARPMTTSELNTYTSKLTEGQRKRVWDALGKLDDWDYSVFEMQSAMAGDDTESLGHQPNGGSLFITCYALMFRLGMMQKFNIDEQLFVNWLTCMEAGYHANPYHNSMHAADVLHITYYILTRGGMTKKCSVTDEDLFATLFAATIHDYDHPGINNSFHVRAQTYLAYLYNDRSILENKHVSSVFEIMKLPRYNILTSLSDDQRRDVRETIIELVLATDMGLHGKYVSQFKRRLQENHDFVKKDDVRLALAMAVKMADISNCGRPVDLYLRWSAKISDEFYMQGDRERNLGMPCSPFMDRNQPAMAKGQIAFMNYIVVPLFDCVSELVPDMHFSIDHTDENKSYWTQNDDS